MHIILCCTDMGNAWAKVKSAIVLQDHTDVNEYELVHSDN